MEFVTIRRYRDLSEAIVARCLLESSGIEVNLRDENLVRLEWQISNLIGGIRLEVESKDEADAIAILDSPIPETIDYGGTAAPFTQPRCPRCQSLDITFEGSSRKAALASLYVAALPLPLGQETWSCQHCGSRWIDTEDP
jgi:hypothetical protein